MFGETREDFVLLKIKQAGVHGSQDTNKIFKFIVSFTENVMKKILCQSKQDNNKRKTNASSFGSLRLNTTFHFVILFFFLEIVFDRYVLYNTNMNRFAAVYIL